MTLCFEVHFSTLISFMSLYQLGMFTSTLMYSTCICVTVRYILVLEQTLNSKEQVLVVRAAAPQVFILYKGETY